MVYNIKVVVRDIEVKDEYTDISKIDNDFLKAVVDAITKVERVKRFKINCKK